MSQESLIIVPSLSVINPSAKMMHPACLLLVELGIFGAAGFTKPNSTIRYSAISAMASIAGYIHLMIHDRMDNRLWKSPVEGAAVYFLLNAVERLLISRWSYEVGGPEQYRKKTESNGNVGHKNTIQSNSSQSLESRFWFILEMVFSLRGVGKPWQVKNVPPFSSRDSTYIPSRRHFLLRCPVLVLPLFIFMDFCATQPLPEADLIAANKQPLFSRLDEISSGEMSFRITASLGFWLTGAAFWIMIYYTVAFVLVGLNVSKPSAWPSAFDWPTKAYSVRQFWGLESFQVHNNKHNG